jgi:hypothetical protein
MTTIQCERPRWRHHAKSQLRADGINIAIEVEIPCGVEREPEALPTLCNICDQESFTSGDDGGRVHATKLMSIQSREA